MTKKKHETNKSMRHRATQEELEERYKNIEALMDSGYRTSEISKAISHRYKIVRRQADRDIKKVRESRSHYLLHNPPVSFRADHYHRLNQIYKESLKEGDRQMALKALEMQEKIIDKTPGGGIPYEKETSQSLPSQLENLLAELEKDRLTE